MTTGLLPDLTASDYHADQLDPERPSLSASLACTLIQKSPAHAYTQHPRLNHEYVAPPAKKEWDLGTVVHSLLLEGTDNVEVIEGYDDWKKQAPKDAAEFARSQGKVPMLRKEWDQASAIVDAAREELACWELDPPLLSDGVAEQPLAWEEDGVLCRCKPDWRRNDSTAVDDVKTTSRGADPEYFARKTVYEHGYDLRAAMYLRGIRAVTGVDARWRWIVVETKPPFVVSVVSPSEQMLAVGNAKLDLALATWRECLASGLWPAYGREVFTAEPPAWELRWLDNSDELMEEAWAQM